MKKIISIMLSILLIASLMTCAAVSTNAATYAEGDIVLYKYVVKCDKIIEAFEGSINYPADDLYVETENDIAIYDGSTGSIAAHDHGNGQILFSVSSSDDVYDFTKGATLAMVAFVVKNPDFDPASVTIDMKNFYDSEHYIKGNIPFSFESFIDDAAVAKGEVNLDTPETTATAESSTAATTEPAESSTVATTEPVTTAPVESNTAATTEPAESDVAETTTPSETDVAETTTPVETTTPAESSTAATTEPAESSTAATTESVESSTAAITEPATTEAPTTEPQPTVCKHSRTKTTTKAATYFAKGKKTITCTACGKALKTTPIAKKVLKTPSVTIKGAKKSIKVTLKKKVKDATGFIVKYKEKGKKKVVTKKYKTNKKVTKVIKKLKKNKKYTVQVRAYVQKGKKIAYSKWKTVKNVKTK